MYRNIDNEYAEKLNAFIEAEEPFKPEHFQKAVGCLPGMHHRVLDLYVYDGKSPTVISAMLDSNVIRIQEIIRYNKRRVSGYARIARGRAESAQTKQNAAADTPGNYSAARKKNISGRAYYCGDTRYIYDLLRKHGMPDSEIARLDLQTRESGIRSWDIIEEYLDKNDMLYRTPFPAISNALKPGNYSLISMELHLEQLLFEPLHYSYCTLTHFKYGCENLPVMVWLPLIRHLFSFRERIIKNDSYLEYLSLQEIELFGILKVDKEHKTIDIIPLIVIDR